MIAADKSNKVYYPFEFSKLVVEEKSKIQEIEDVYKVLAKQNDVDLKQDIHYVKFENASNDLLQLFGIIEKINRKLEFSDGQIAALMYPGTRQDIYQIIKECEKHGILKPFALETIKLRAPVQDNDDIWC